MDFLQAFFHKSPAVSSTRHHYTDRRLFEQSVDVYRPTKMAEAATKDPSSLIVLLTVGSGWMGHQPFIYRGCAWWNSAGPRTVASALGCPCVCIRHRGAYFHLPSWITLVSYCSLPLGILGAILWDKVGREYALGLLLLWTTACVLLKWSACQSASLDDMVEDVATAIAWVRDNKDLILLHSDGRNPHSTMRTINEDGHHNSSCQLVFGGYSSGGHVSATLLQRPADYWKQHGLPPPNEMFSGILYISGVLAVQPSTLVDRHQNSKRAGAQRNEDEDDATTGTSSSSFSSQYEARSEGDNNPTSPPKNFIVAKPLVHSKAKQHPIWLTNFVCRTVWGPDWRTQVPSPLDEIARNSHASSTNIAIPHLVIQNRHEVFGLSWLDIFFCGEAYCHRLEHQKIPSIFRQVSSDHWNILASRALHDALLENMPTLLQMKKG